MQVHVRPRLDPHSLERAGRVLLGAVTGGADWTSSLDDLLPVFGGVGCGLARVTPPSLVGLPSSSLKDVVTAIATRRTPPLSRLTRVETSPEEDFVCDQMERFARARAKDAFTQEFVRPSGLAYQASAFMDRTDADAGSVDFLIFRGPGSGGFEPDDLATLRILLPYVRSATMASRAALQSQADRRAGVYQDRGDPVLHLSADGRLRERSADDAKALAPDVRLVGGRLALTLSADQRRLDVAVAAALTDGKPGLVTVAGAESASLRLLVMPVLGHAIEVFRTTAVLIAVLDVSRPPRVDRETVDLLADAVGLSQRETEVVHLLAGGCTPRRSSEILGIAYETARLHLKSAYAKSGVHSQAELTALVGRLSGR